MRRSFLESRYLARPVLFTLEGVMWRGVVCHSHPPARLPAHLTDLGLGRYSLLNHPLVTLSS